MGARRDSLESQQELGRDKERIMEDTITIHYIQMYNCQKKLQNTLLGLERWLSQESPCPRTDVKKPGMAVFLTLVEVEKSISGSC